MECCICSEALVRPSELLAPRTCIPQCGHGMHGQCLALWVTRGRRSPLDSVTCPVCRADIGTPEHIGLQLSDLGIDVEAIDREYPEADDDHPPQFPAPLSVVPLCCPRRVTTDDGRVVEVPDDRRMRWSPFFRLGDTSVCEAQWVCYACNTVVNADMERMSFAVHKPFYSNAKCVSVSSRREFCIGHNRMQSIIIDCSLDLAVNPWYFACCTAEHSDVPIVLGCIEHPPDGDPLTIDSDSQEEPDIDVELAALASIANRPDSIDEEIEALERIARS
eukprot:9484328-Pyramimonas_sp.AAC.4